MCCVYVKYCLLAFFSLILWYFKSSFSFFPLGHLNVSFLSTLSVTAYYFILFYFFSTLTLHVFYPFISFEFLLYTFSVYGFTLNWPPSLPLVFIFLLDYTMIGLEIGNAHFCATKHSCSLFLVHCNCVVWPVFYQCIFGVIVTELVSIPSNYYDLLPIPPFFM